MQTAQASTQQEQCTHAHGIKSAMHVKVVAPNKLMFIDEPEPPDDKGDAFGKGGIDHMEGVEDTKAMSEENDTEEIVAETPPPRPDVTPSASTFCLTTISHVYF